MNEIKKIVSEPEVVLEPEVVEESEAPHAAPASRQSLFPLTAERLARLTLEIGDPVQQTLGYFYEMELRRECHQLVPRALYARDMAQIERALATFQVNPQWFVCRSIGVVLLKYLNHAQGRIENEF